MKIFYFVFILFFISFNANSEKIATFKLSHIFSNLIVYNEFLNELESFKKKKFEELKVIENSLLIKKNEIEDSKILLSEDEFNKRVNQFNIEKRQFEEKINNINILLQKNLEINEAVILNEIAKITKQIAIQKNIDIILSEEQYYLASDNIDISNLIFEKLNNIEIKLKLTDFDD